MAFTYTFGNNPQIDFVRLLIPDTQEKDHIFEDSELLAFYQIQAAQFQTGMFYSSNAGTNLPASPVSYLRVAALALDSIASSKARTSAVIGLLDVKLASPEAVVKALQARAESYRATDDDAGAFAIIEQCPTVWSFEQRYWNQVQRQQGGGGIG